MQERNAHDWIKADKPEGQNGRAKAFKEQYENAAEALARIQVIVFFLVNELGMNECLEILTSCRRQRSFIKAMEINLRKCKVEDEWVRPLQSTLTNLRGRFSYLHDIVIPEIIRMTDIYPYFRQKGFEVLDDYADDYFRKKKNKIMQRKVVMRLRDDISTWKKENSNEIVDYMESIAAERGNRMRRKA